MTRNAVVWSVVLLSVGCDCGRGPGTVRRSGSLVLRWQDDQGEWRRGREAHLDFGVAFPGEVVTRVLVARNEGTGPLSLSGWELEGEGVSAFALPEVSQLSLGSDEETLLELSFRPPSQAPGPVEARVLLSVDGEQDEPAAARLRGEVGRPQCQLPRELDFGAVALGERAVASLRLGNASGASGRGLVEAPTPEAGEPLAFGLAAGAPQGPVELGAGEEREVQIEFQPTALGRHRAAMRAASVGCPEAQIVLLGEGVSEVLTWSPPSVDFGFLLPGARAERVVSFQNRGKQAILLSALHTTLPGDFAVRPAPGADPTALWVPGESTAPLTLVFSPSGLGARSAALELQTPLVRAPRGSVPLRGYGGGPNIFVSPRPTLAFGQVTFQAPPGTPLRFQRRVTVMNTGVVAPDDQGNLHLGTLEVLPGPDTRAGEFGVQLPSGYDPARGLEAAAGRNVMDLTVTFQPISAGRKAAELLIRSNDPDEPVVRLALSADAQPSTPCRYSVTPATLNFGLVTPPDARTLSVTLTNLGTGPQDRCVLSDATWEPGTHAAYSLAGSPSFPMELQPRQSVQLAVRVEPPAAAASQTKLSGALLLDLPSAAQPRVRVPVETAVGPSCLVVAPDPLDFGSVKVGCASPIRTFHLYNVCSQWLDLTAISMGAAAGQPPGGPDCPGPSACPEFLLASSPAIPSGGLTLNPGAAPVTFSVRYRPIDLGKDLGAVSIQTQQGSRAVQQWVSLEGTGAATGIRTDHFVQPAVPKADILFVVDDSSSMQDKQTNLANNFASFIQHAKATRADYQLGVTTTDDDLASFYKPTGPMGKLLFDSSNPKILTPATPNLEQKFKDKVNVGIAGSALEKGLACATRAVTAPLVTGDNAGFLRADAHLAILIVTDAPDQSPLPSTYYLQRLQNVKGVHRPHLLTVGVVGPFSTPVPGCTYDGNGDDGRYAQTVTQTGGLMAEICSSQWGSALTALGKSALGLKTTFFLSATPDLSAGKTLEVAVNGAALPATSGTVVNWTYQPVSNSVEVAAAKAPGPGQTLSVTYQTPCL